jgi:hypothetical protein
MTTAIRHGPLGGRNVRYGFEVYGASADRHVQYNRATKTAVAAEQLRRTAIVLASQSSVARVHLKRTAEARLQQTRTARAIKRATARAIAARTATVVRRAHARAEATRSALAAVRAAQRRATLAAFHLNASISPSMVGPGSYPVLTARTSAGASCRTSVQYDDQDYARMLDGPTRTANVWGGARACAVNS